MKVVYGGLLTFIQFKSISSLLESLYFHGCYRRHFSKFLDFSKIKIWFPQPNKYKMSHLFQGHSLWANYCLAIAFTV